MTASTWSLRRTRQAVDAGDVPWDAAGPARWHDDKPIDRYRYALR
jgi:hypothetical protein